MKEKAPQSKIRKKIIFLMSWLNPRENQAHGEGKSIEKISYVENQHYTTASKKSLFRKPHISEKKRARESERKKEKSKSKSKAAEIAPHTRNRRKMSVMKIHSYIISKIMAAKKTKKSKIIEIASANHTAREEM